MNTLGEMGEQWADEDLPPGAETETTVSCPYCGAVLEISLDPGGGAQQSYIEDCEVCCRPMQLTVDWDEDGLAHVDARTEDDA